MKINSIGIQPHDLKYTCYPDKSDYFNDYLALLSERLTNKMKPVLDQKITFAANSLNVSKLTLYSIKEMEMVFFENHVTKIKLTSNSNSYYQFSIKYHTSDVLNMLL